MGDFRFGFFRAARASSLIFRNSSFFRNSLRRDASSCASVAAWRLISLRSFAARRRCFGESDGETSNFRPRGSGSHGGFPQFSLRALITSPRRFEVEISRAAHISAAHSALSLSGTELIPFLGRHVSCDLVAQTNPPRPLESCGRNSYLTSVEHANEGGRSKATGIVLADEVRKGCPREKFENNLLAAVFGSAEARSGKEGENVDD